MTMTKGKKQPSDGPDGDISLRSSTLMSDDEYAQVGSVLGPTGRFGDGVMVNPIGYPQDRLAISQTPLGRMAPSLMTVFGLNEALTDLFLWAAQPRCSTCGGLARRSESFDRNQWPDHGYIAVVVDGIEESVSLEEQCELLEVERAVIDGLLIRKEDVAGRTGEPVLSIATVSDVPQVSREVERWLARGGSPLRLVHFASRNDRGVDLQKIFKEWRCSTCGVSYPSVSRQGIEDAPPCQRCRGEGWLLASDDRWIACDDCDAFGRTSAFARYEIAGTLLKDISQITFQAVSEYLANAPWNGVEYLRERVVELCDEGFSRYPIGTPLALLSKGERVLATIASARLSKLSNVKLFVDSGALGASSSWVRSLTTRHHLPSLRVIEPTTCDAGPCEISTSAAHVFTLREVVVGPLSIPTVSFDVGGLIAIQGEPGVGKSLLLREIERRFSKRKKLAHLAAFGNLKRCHLVQSDSPEGETVMEVLGIASSVAEQTARSRHAREKGLAKEDFLRGRSPYRCPLCKGIPGVGDEICSLCDGGLFDHVVGGVVVANVPFAELMRGSLERIGAALWADDMLTGVLDRVPSDLRASLCVGGSVRRIGPHVRRFLSTLGPLASVLARKGPLEGELFLLDAPFGTLSSYQSVLIQCIKELSSRGATIVCAGVPETLENIFSSVVRLRLIADPRRKDGVARFLDIRMTQKSEVVSGS